MARPTKCRRVCLLPSNTEFTPACSQAVDETVVMGIDEYETIRLIDLEGLQQEEAAGQMNVARTTVQAIYNNARKKLADCLVNGKRLLIQGGQIEVCCQERPCGRGVCPKRGGGCTESHAPCMGYSSQDAVK